jgi:hypothetical protein
MPVSSMKQDVGMVGLIPWNVRIMQRTVGESTDNLQEARAVSAFS